MKSSALRSRRSLASFTLVEMLVVIAIIALLAALFTPALQMSIKKAQSMKCAGNLRSIGIAVGLACADNNNTYPEIDQQAIPIYTPPGPGLVTVLAPYGITTNVVQCPVDLLAGPAAACNNSSYHNPGSSYTWTPAFDDESVNATLIYINPSTPIPVTNTRVRLVSDYNPLHHGRQNVLYGDGHVAVH
jgi:prepilin-type N-terminal cleavage/methylation domain-containing protein/prepilin-type processing-associated H-X9-DG protein